jgi:hypothetical protein
MLTIVAVLFAIAAFLGAVAVTLGWVADSTQAVRRWYPAAPDIEGPRE